MTQELLPISSTDANCAIIGAATPEECVDDGVGGADNNATYINWLSEGDACTLLMGKGISTGGIFTGWQGVIRSRRVGAQAFPDREPIIQVEIMAGALVVRTDMVLHTGGSAFTNYTQDLTPVEAALLDLADVRMRLTVIQLKSGNAARTTLASFLMADPLILIDACPLTIGFGQLQVPLGGTGSRRAAVAVAGGVGQGAYPGGRAQVNKCP